MSKFHHPHSPRGKRRGRHRLGGSRERRRSGGRTESNGGPRFRARLPTAGTPPFEVERGLVGHASDGCGPREDFRPPEGVAALDARAICRRLYGWSNLRLPASTRPQICRHTIESAGRLRWNSQLPAFESLGESATRFSKRDLNGAGWGRSWAGNGGSLTVGDSERERRPLSLLPFVFLLCSFCVDRHPSASSELDSDRNPFSIRCPFTTAHFL